MDKRGIWDLNVRCIVPVSGARGRYGMGVRGMLEAVRLAHSPCARLRKATAAGARVRCAL